MRRFGFVPAIVIIAVFMTVSTASAYLFRYDGTYKGRIIDAETKEPIEGVVVLGVWYNEEPNVAGSTSTYYDASETVTDENGEFKIQGQGLKIFSYVGTMQVLLFKAGYEYIGSGPWESLKWDGGLLINKVNFEGNKPIIPLKKLTMRERKELRNPSDPPEQAPLKKVINMLREIDKNRIERGLEPSGIWNGEKYE